MWPPSDPWWRLRSDPDQAPPWHDLPDRRRTLRHRPRRCRRRRRGGDRRHHRSETVGRRAPVLGKVPSGPPRLPRRHLPLLTSQPRRKKILDRRPASRVSRSGTPPAVPLHPRSLPRPCATCRSCALSEAALEALVRGSSGGPALPNRPSTNARRALLRELLIAWTAAVGEKDPVGLGVPNGDWSAEVTGELVPCSRTRPRRSGAARCQCPFSSRRTKVPGRCAEQEHSSYDPW